VSRTRAYRCLTCLEHTIEREFDTSHLSVTCPNCESFERFVNEAVFQQFEAFEASPPSELDWNRLDRMEKLVVAERLVRSTKTLDDFEVVDGAAADGAGDRDEADEGVAEESGESAEETDESVENSDGAADESGETADRDDRSVDETSDGATSEVVAKGSGETA
jgi:DNA-directed RNA polymerase subunit RPC12/RpoP